MYRALNWGTGETVAVKQIKLADLPKGVDRSLQIEIDLLKNLNHPNIVKYNGFVKSSECLYIILEYCENGSLHSICKNFGKFPENLVALYMSQVLRGLSYLHEEGVIHRDIKGANILTTKEGLVKLADFGVATRKDGLHESSVVGTPYWMAPEVIELAGATTASDVWSLGCTVIELLDGKPPYHQFQPMPALFRIVNDDHPPLPEGASPAVRDFLMQCFQKDPNLRVSAQKLLKHPWIVSARRSDHVVAKKYDEAIKSVREWNEALKSPDATVKRPGRMSVSPVPPRPDVATSMQTPAPAKGPLEIGRKNPRLYQSPDDTSSDNWDDDFASEIDSKGLQLPHLRPHDNFAGMFSSDKLKRYATFDTVPEQDNWDENFEGDLTVRTVLKSRSPAQSPKSRSQAHRPAKKPEQSIEDYSDLVAHDDAAFHEKVAALQSEKDDSFSPRLFHPSDLQSLPRSLSRASSAHQPSQTKRAVKRTRSEVEIQKYAEDVEDEDFSDIFEKDESQQPVSTSATPDGMMLQNLSISSWAEEEEEDDPFAQLEEGFDEMDLETNVARDKHARLCTLVEGLVSSLKLSQPEDFLMDIVDQLMQVLFESPDMQAVVISAHGMLPILEILETSNRPMVILRLLKIVNMLLLDNVEIQENICFVGGIPIITRFAQKRYSSDIRLEAAAFVRMMYQTSTLTLQMFVSCGGLNVLVEFLEEDYEVERDLVLIGVNGVWSVFELQGPTPKNDFCRIFSRSAILYPLSLVLNRVLEEEEELAELIEGRIVNIFLLFSQAENHVKETIADRMVLKRVLKDLRRMSPTHQVTMLKFIKNLSMLATTLDALQNSNAIEVLTDLLNASMKLPHFREISNQVLNIMYNLCRLSKERQEDAALNGVIPLLQRVVKTDRPLKEFALPIMCDMAHSGKVGRKILWQNKGLQFYISLLADQYWQVTALDAIFIWYVNDYSVVAIDKTNMSRLQEETAKVEEHLLSSSDFCTAVVSCFSATKADSFEGILEPLQRLMRLSPLVASSLAHPDLFARIGQKLHSRKALVRLNLLRIIRSICDASDEDGELISRYGLEPAINDLAAHDTAILVREMASDLIKSSELVARRSMDGANAAARRSVLRRSSSSTMTLVIPSASSSGSLPPTPSSDRLSSSTSRSSFFEDLPRPLRSIAANSSPYRPASRNGLESPVSTPMPATPGLAGMTKSRLPRTRTVHSNAAGTFSRPAGTERLSLATSGLRHDDGHGTRGSPLIPSAGGSRGSIRMKEREKDTDGDEGLLSTARRRRKMTSHD